MMEDQEKPRKISPDQVEIVGTGSQGQTPAFKSPFEGTPFGFKNIKVISAGPMMILLPLLLPLVLLLMIVLFVPLMIFGRRSR